VKEREFSPRGALTRTFVNWTSSAASAEAAAREAARAEAATQQLHALAQARIEDLTASLASERHAAETLREQLTAALRRPPASRPGKTPKPER